MRYYLSLFINMLYILLYKYFSFNSSVSLKERFASFTINIGQEIAVCVTNYYYYILFKQRRNGLLLIIISLWLDWYCCDGCGSVAFGI